MVQPLSADKIAEALAKLEFNWRVENNKLITETQTKDFKEAVWVIDEVAKAAEELNHHPDINLSNYNLLELKLSTHDVDGVTEKDLALAERIDAILARLK